MSISLSTPLSLYSIPLVWFTAFYPMRMKYHLIQGTIGFNNIQPRANLSRLAEKGEKVPKPVLERAQRMEGANLNGNEVFPLWIAAVLTGNIVGLPQETLNICSLAFIISRVVYNHVYINQTTKLQSVLRSLVWTIGISIPMYLLIKSANVTRVVEGVL